MPTAHPLPAFRKTAESFKPGSRSLPQRYFVSPEVFAAERDNIFCSSWLCVGHQNQIPDLRDYFVQQVAGDSLIFLRDNAGKLRAFWNTCRHRGTRLCEEKS